MSSDSSSKEIFLSEFLEEFLEKEDIFFQSSFLYNFEDETDHQSSPATFSDCLLSVRTCAPQLTRNRGFRGQSSNIMTEYEASSKRPSRKYYYKSDSDLTDLEKSAYIKAIKCSQYPLLNLMDSLHLDCNQQSLVSPGPSSQPSSGISSSSSVATMKKHIAPTEANGQGIPGGAEATSDTTSEHYDDQIVDEELQGYTYGTADVFSKEQKSKAAAGKPTTAATTTSELKPALFLDHLHRAFHLTPAVIRQLASLTPINHSQKTQCLIEDFQIRLRALEGNEVGKYTPKDFLYATGYDLWHFREESILRGILQHLPGGRLQHSHQMSFESSQAEYEVLFRKLLERDFYNLDMSSTMCGESLSLASDAILREFRLRYCIGEVHATALHLQHVLSEEFFQLTTPWLRDIEELTQRLWHFVSSVSPQERLITYWELELIHDVLNRLDDVIRVNSVEKDALLYFCESAKEVDKHGIEHLLSTVSLVFDLKTHLGWSNTKFDKAGFLEASIKEACFSMYEKILRHICRNGESVPKESELSYLVDFCLDKAAKLSNSLIPHLGADIQRIIRQCLYARLMDVTVLYFNERYEMGLADPSIYREELALIHQLIGLDAAWNMDISHSSHLWRREAFKLSTVWLKVLKRSCKLFLRSSLLNCEFRLQVIDLSTVTCFEKSQMHVHYTQASSLPYSIASPPLPPHLQFASPGSAFYPSLRRRTDLPVLQYEETSLPRPTQTLVTSVGSLAPSLYGFDTVDLPLPDGINNCTVDNAASESLENTLEQQNNLRDISNQQQSSQSNITTASAAVGANSSQSNSYYFTNSSALIDFLCILRRFVATTESIKALLTSTSGLSTRRPTMSQTSGQVVVPESSTTSFTYSRNTISLEERISLMKELWEDYLFRELEAFLSITRIFCYNLIWIDICGTDEATCRDLLKEEFLQGILTSKSEREIWLCKHTIHKIKCSSLAVNQSSKQSTKMLKNVELPDLSIIIRLNDLLCVRDVLPLILQHHPSFCVMNNRRETECRKELEEKVKVLTDEIVFSAEKLFVSYFMTPFEKALDLLPVLRDHNKLCLGCGDACVSSFRQLHAIFLRYLSPSVRPSLHRMVRKSIYSKSLQILSSSDNLAQTTLALTLHNVVNEVTKLFDVSNNIVDNDSYTRIRTCLDICLSIPPYIVCGAYLMLVYPYPVLPTTNYLLQFQRYAQAVNGAKVFNETQFLRYCRENDFDKLIKDGHHDVLDNLRSTGVVVRAPSNIKSSIDNWSSSSESSIPDFNSGDWFVLHFPDRMDDDLLLERMNSPLHVSISMELSLRTNPLVQSLAISCHECNIPTDWLLTLLKSRKSIDAYYRAALHFLLHHSSQKHQLSQRIQSLSLCSLS